MLPFQMGLKSCLFAPSFDGERYRCCPVKTQFCIVGPPLSNKKQVDAIANALATGFHEPEYQMTTPKAVAKATALKDVTKTRSNPGTIIRPEANLPHKLNEGLRPVQ